MMGGDVTAPSPTRGDAHASSGMNSSDPSGAFNDVKKKFRVLVQAVRSRCGWTLSVCEYQV